MTDRLLEYMKKHNIPVTREQYLALNYGSDYPDDLTADEEASLPEEIQNLKADENDPARHG